MFFKCGGERENLRKMKVTYFVLKIDEQRKRNFENVAQHETKKKPTDEVKRAMRM